MFCAQRYTGKVSVTVSNRTRDQAACKLSRGANNPTLMADGLAERRLTSAEDVNLKDELVRDGSRDNLQLTLDT